MEDVSFCSKGDIQLSLLPSHPTVGIKLVKEWLSQNRIREHCQLWILWVQNLYSGFWVNIWKAKKLVHKRMLSSLRFLAFYVVNILINNIRIHGWELLINSVLQWNKVPEFKRWLLLLHSEAAVPVLLLVLELSVPCRTKLTASVCVVCSYM